ncbi:cellulase family glycosylhydrolase [Thermococcus sp. SY098]|uniref:glycoside hydrolase 5 family protein n=1 Tax=Thermococcus sp. SY098 TaxID=3111325 RepID=UPI002D77F2AC|nr:cellulase family glycosylhydrolase [Thermococcus sp. SY098]WRS52017.1 cellulase family glycosylhydrolase [Thermococcus sp. SY098]
MDFVLGVNYWPRKKAMFWWKQFDEKEVWEEFSIIKELNLDVVRIFLLWEDFQPEIDKIDNRNMKNLEKVLDIAKELDLMVIPTFFIGHMSGINWLPEWLLEDIPHERFLTYSNGKIVDKRARDIYEDKKILKAEELLLDTVTSELRDFPNIYAWDISNEIDNVRIPRTPEVAKRWLKFVYETIKSNDPRPVTFGIHQEDIDRNKNFRVPDVAQYNDFLCMHAYSVYTDFTDPLDPYFVPFACILTKALGGKNVLMEEFGMPTTQDATKKIVSATGKDITEHYLINENEAAEWLKETLKLLYEFGTIGALYWNFSDYHESLWDKPPFDKAIHERFFGILRSDGSLKPTALALKEFKEKIPSLKRTEYVPINVPKNYYEKPKENLVKLYKEFLRKIGR